MNYEKWDEILAPYQHAVEELKVKFKNIRKEFLTKGEYSPIEFVTGRTKKISSIISKANRLDTNDIEGKIDDIAGIRIMCQFVEDIYTIVELIKNRTDMTVINEKDYITNFKESGYRSYHVIIKYTVNMVDGAKDILAEFQIRTLAMNFWATAEHSLNYKYKQHIPEEIKIRLKKAADAAFELDQQMLEIKDEIKDAQKLFEVKSDIISSIMNNILTLISLGKVAEAARYEVLLNRLIEEGEVWELNNLLDITKKDLERYKDN